MSMPPLREMFARLIATPSVSSTTPALDCPNEGVTALLDLATVEPTLALLRELVARFCVAPAA
jgi:hypothetical protein